MRSKRMGSEMRPEHRFAYALLHATTTGVILTGLVYGTMRYLLHPIDPFSIANHPLEPLFHRLHVLFSPAMTLMLGAFWIWHAWPYFQDREERGRLTGLTILVTALPMVFSGYFLQTATDDSWRQIWIILHVVSSLLWTGALIAHIVIHIRNKD
ncbi:MAG: hypothetical protein O3C57_04160 [Verrucomicrobia bacterium]|nr:hypothetical protein [Verrucomicrobiota bacterium]